MARSVELLEKLPHQYRLVVAKGIVQYTGDNKLLGTTEELKSLGHEKVLGLIQSKARRRWYDQDPILHRAVNNILLMAEEDRQTVSYRLVVALESIETHLENSQKEDRLVETVDIEQIVNDVFTRNVSELLEFTNKTPVKDQKLLVPSDRDPDSKVVDEDMGMKLSAMMMDDND